MASGHKDDAAPYRKHSLGPESDVVGVGGGSLLVLIIGTPDTLHTHTTSSLYIYNAIQHLQQWLVVIRM